MLSKDELRKEIRRLKKQHTPEELAEMSVPVIETLEGLSVFQNARTIMAYYSLPDEVCTRALIEKWAGKKDFLLPVVEGRDMLLKPYRKSEGMRLGALNVQEPNNDEIFTDYDKIDLVIVPGMAFDSKCNRMGRGGGFYDRFLPKVARAQKAGICFPFQFFEEIPCEAFDKPMDWVVSTFFISLQSL